MKTQVKSLKCSIENASVPYPRTTTKQTSMPSNTKNKIFNRKFFRKQSKKKANKFIKIPKRI